MYFIKDKLIPKNSDRMYFIMPKLLNVEIIFKITKTYSHLAHKVVHLVKNVRTQNVPILLYQ